MQPDVGDVGNPELIDSGQLHPAGQVQIHLQLMLRVRSYDESFWLNREQVILAHDPSYSLVVHHHPVPPKFGRNPPVAIAPPMFDGDLLNRRAHLHILLHRRPFLQTTVETGPADTGYPAHLLNTQAALHRHHFSDLFVDAVPPELPLLWRRASILCKAPLKKSASNVLSATRRVSCETCWRNSRSREFAGGPSPSSIGSN